LVARLSDQAYVDVWSSSHAKKYNAVKVLTVDATRGNQAHILQEVEIMQAVSVLDDNDNLPILYDHFEHDGPYGRHLCLVMEPLTTDISSFRRTTPRKALPVHTVKIVIIHVLEALKALHEAKIIHAGKSFFIRNVFPNWS
jgi:serine/threonine-protein kinase SRPK3